MQRKTSAWIFQRVNSLGEFGQTCLSPSFATLASLAVQLFFQVETFSIPATARQLGRIRGGAVVSATDGPSSSIRSAPAAAWMMLASRARIGKVIMASASMPGAFPPVMMIVEVNGKA